MSNPNPKPSPATQFKPGQSGNPKGGSKLATAKKNAKEELRQLEIENADKPMKFILGLIDDPKVKVETRLRAAEFCHEVFNGKSVQKIEQTTTDLTPVPSREHQKTIELTLDEWSEKYGPDAKSLKESKKAE